MPQEAHNPETRMILAATSLASLRMELSLSLILIAERYTRPFITIRVELDQKALL
jgi:hypothetical protein